MDVSRPIPRAALRHGGHTREARALQREIMTLIRESKDLLQSFND